jgi:CubicO group peptidase (beta-lactamase class C family)
VVLGGHSGAKRIICREDIGMKIMRSLYSFVVLVLCTTSVLTGPSRYVHRQGSMEAERDASIRLFLDGSDFSGSVLVVRDGVIVFCKSYRMANYELDIPNTSKTKFRIGSITKQFTAMAIMQLQEKGLLRVTDRVSKYIPDYPHGDIITIHQLLTHTSGIPTINAFSEYRAKDQQLPTFEQVIKLFKNKPLDFKPGKKYRYSNSGYVLLSYIIEKASGETYETVLQKQIFAPLRMHNSGYDQAQCIIKNRASGYCKGVGDVLMNAPYADMSFSAGAGGIYSTVEDLYAWDQALYSNKLLSKKSQAILFKPHVANPDFPHGGGWHPSGYGYGWFIGKLCNRTVWAHRGLITGFSAAFLRYPDDNVCIIVLSNFFSGSPWKIAMRLSTLVFGGVPALSK